MDFLFSSVQLHYAINHYEKIADIGFMLGIYESDVVVVQSEANRKQYIESIVRYGPKISIDMVDKKVVALGTPNVDKV